MRMKLIGAVALALSVASLLCLTLTGALAFDETKYPDWKGGWRRVAFPASSASRPTIRPSAAARRRRRR